MEGFTPAFFLQVVLTVGAIAVGYGMLKADLRNISTSLEEERRLRERHVHDTHETFRDVHSSLQEHHGRISRIEGQQDLASDITNNLKRI